MKIGTTAITLSTVFSAAISLQAFQAPSSGPMPMMMHNCPMMIKDVEVNATDAPAGIALTFTAKPEQVDDLRLRVQRWATMHTEKPGQMSAMAQSMMPGTATYEAIPNGARLTLTPKDPAKLAEFRVAVRKHVETMKKGECMMMQQMMQGMPAAQKPEAPAKPADPQDHTQHHPEQPK